MPGSLKGKPRGRRWTEGEIALLEAILDRADDGVETARHREVVAVAERTGRSREAVVQKLHKLRAERRKAAAGRKKLNRWHHLIASPRKPRVSRQRVNATISAEEKRRGATRRAVEAQADRRALERAIGW